MSWRSIPGFMAFRRVYDYYLDKVAKDGDTVVEIGCLFGRSIAYLAEKAAARGLKLDIVAVDLWEDNTWGWLPAGHPWREMTKQFGGPFEAFQRLLAKHSPDTRVRTMKMRSHEARTHFEPRSCGMVFVDGDHSFEGCREDILDWKDVVREGGLFAGDDYHPLSFPDVVRAVKETLGDDITINGTSWLAGKHDLSKPRSNAVFSIKRDAIGVFASARQEYDLGSMSDLDDPTILDIGANAGVFALYALERWEGGKVLAYEPHPETFQSLVQNVSGLPVECVQAAVVHPKKSETGPLWEGVNSDIECSVRNDVRWPHVSQRIDEPAVQVPYIDADTLPECDVLKVDTEGSEVEILTGFGEKLKKVQALLVEAHAVGGDLKGQVDQIVALAQAAGLNFIDVRGTTLRFTRDETRPALSGDWWHLHAVGGEEYIGLSRGEDGATMSLAPAFRCASGRIIVPVPIPGGQIVASNLDPVTPSVWSPMHLPHPRAVQVRWSSRMKLSDAEVKAALGDLV